MKMNSRLGLFVAGVSIVFSVLSSGVYFAFTPVFALSALIGSIGVAAALASQSRRTALVVAVTALVPTGQLLVEQFFEEELLVLLPPAVAFATACCALRNYSLRRKAQPGPAAEPGS